MSPALSVVVIVGGLLVLVTGWVALTQRTRPSTTEPEPIVEWRRPLNHRIAHAFRVAELRMERFDAQALALCGAWPVTHLVPVAELTADDGAPRCAVCTNAVERLEQRRE
jgi:hypothetical protein